MSLAATEGMVPEIRPLLLAREPVRPVGHHSFGVPRLDGLLGGGIPPGSALLLHGPPFCGKGELALQAIGEALRMGVPVTVAHCSRSPQETLARISSVHAGAEAAFAQGRLTLRQAQPEAESGFQPGLLVVESASSLMMERGARQAFQSLRPLLAQATQGEGAALVVLEAGMHTEAEVQAMKLLCNGMLEFRRKGDLLQFHVEGLATLPARAGWVDYEWGSQGIRVTGSFALRRIR